LVVATGYLADLAAAFLVWSAGMVVALPDLPPVGTAAPESRSFD